MHPYRTTRITSASSLVRLVAVALGLVACGSDENDGGGGPPAATGGTTTTTTGGAGGSGGTSPSAGGPSGGGGSSNGGGSGSGRGPLVGGTYCEKLASCCGQIASFEQRERCDEDLLDALEDPADAENGCRTSAASYLSLYWCGPPGAGTISGTYEFGAEPPASFQCVVQASPAATVFTRLIHIEGTDSATLECWGNAASTERLEFTVGTALGTITDVDPLSATFAFRLPGSAALTPYSRTMLRTQSSTTEAFELAGDVAELRGHYTASWDMSLDGTQPGLDLSITYDVTFPVLRANGP